MTVTSHEFVDPRTCMVGHCHTRLLVILSIRVQKLYIRKNYVCSASIYAIQHAEYRTTRNYSGRYRDGSMTVRYGHGTITAWAATTKTRAAGVINASYNHNFILYIEHIKNAARVSKYCACGITSRDSTVSGRDGADHRLKLSTETRGDGLKYMIFCQRIQIRQLYFRIFRFLFCVHVLGNMVKHISVPAN